MIKCYPSESQKRDIIYITAGENFIPLNLKLAKVMRLIKGKNQFMKNVDSLLVPD